MRLTQAERGRALRIVGLPPGRAGDHLVRLGLIEGAVIWWEGGRWWGPVIVHKDRHELALGRRLAEAIQVEPLDATETSVAGSPSGERAPGIGRGGPARPRRRRRGGNPLAAG